MEALRSIHQEINRSTGTKITFFLFLMLLLIIPSGVFLLSERYKVQKGLNFGLNLNKPITNIPKEVPNLSPIDELKNALKNLTSDQQTPPAPLGPSMDLKISLEGRPLNNFSTKLFLGLAQGEEAIRNPEYLLILQIDIPKSGEYKNISLAGLSPGTSYVVYLKGLNTIDQAVKFNLGTNIVKLNNLEAIRLTAGDLNEDNIINNDDVKIVQKFLGATSKLETYSQNADFNLDGVINNFDLKIVSDNLNKAGDSGPWFSKIKPSTGTTLPESSSSGLENEMIKEVEGGYWLFVPTIKDNNNSYN